VCDAERMVRTPSVVVAALTLGAIALTACGAPIPDISTSSTIAMPLGGPCPSDGSGGSDFTGESDELRVTVSADDIPTPVEATGDIGTLTVEAVPEGEKRAVGVFGMRNGLPLWRGVARSVSIKQGEETKIDVLMARIADVTCARSPDAAARAFHTSTLLADGRVLITGGATGAPASGTCTGCQTHTATASASLYDPKTGAIAGTANMSVPRMGHVAVLLDDGRVVIAGGARSLTYNPDTVASPFPFSPPDGAVLSSVEVFDPDTGAFSPVDTAACQGCVARLFAAGAPAFQGEMVITGGIPAADTPHDLGNALSTTTVCGGNPLSCRSGPPMARPRAGHVAVRIDQQDGVFLLGGSVDVSVVGSTPGFQFERWDGSAAFILLSVAAMNVDRNLFFAAAAQYVPFRVLMAGGLRRDASGSFRVATIDVGGSSVAPVILYDRTFNVDGGIVIGPDSSAPMHLRGPRWYGAAAALPGNTRAVFAGGFTSIALVPSVDLDIFDEGTISTDPISVGGQARTLRAPRGALSAVAVGDGTVVLSGGVSDGNAALQTVEVFADPKTPAGVAE
jgi:Galactose oxidase, central domain